MNELVSELRSFPSRLLEAIHGITESDLRREEGDGAWSILDVIAHLSDLELVSAVRWRKVLAEEEPELPSLDQVRSTPTHRGESLEELMEAFSFERRRNIVLLERCNGEPLQRKGKHPDYGLLSIRDMAERLRSHQEQHLAQIERIKKTHGLTAADSIALNGVVSGRAGEARIVGDGIRVRPMWGDGVRSALLVEIDAGAVWPHLDQHIPGPEEVFVVSGTLGDGANEYEAGTFIHNPAGSSHIPQSKDGCVLFVFYPQG